MKTIEQALKEELINNQSDHLLNKDEFKDLILSGNEILVGYDDEYRDLSFPDKEPFSNAEYVVKLDLSDSDNIKYNLYNWYYSTSGDDLEGDIDLYFDSIDELYDYILDLKLRNCPLKR